MEENDNNNCDDRIIIHFFNTCGIKCEKLSDLDGMILYRNDFIFSEKYENIKLIIYDLKKILSSSIYTSLHSDAERKQKYPLINVIRQVLKSMNYKLIPKRLSDGYTCDGIKKYKRLFIIQK